MAGDDAKTGDGDARFVSSYATGGGGVVFEHRYGALLLSQLLLGDPVDELGADVTPISVRFQASAESAVDDLLVKGRTVDGGERWLSIGVRHAPRLVASDASTRSLLGQYLRVVHDAWDRVRDGGWRLALVVGTDSGPLRELKALAEAASGSPDRASFTVRVADEVAASARGRRDQLVTIARGAAADLELRVGFAEELLYRVLHVLRVRVARIEGGDTADLTSAIAGLRRAVPDHDLAMAGALSDRLAGLAERYAAAGAIVDEVLLRRDLSGLPLRRSRSWAAAWRVLDRLADGLRAQTGSRLQSGERDLELPRATVRDELTAAMRDVGSALIVHGEPDVGKSALALRGGEALAESGAAVTRLSLRDLPATTHELERLLGGTLHDVLAATAVADLRLLIVDGAEAVLEGRGPLLADLAAAARDAGLGVVVVTRDDALAAVRRNLGALDAPPRDYAVQALTGDELDEIAAAFASIRSLRRRPRGRGLLGRPGLVALLLRSGPGEVVDDVPLSEAVVFTLVWRRLVRHDEDASRAPDSRERALVALARRALLGIGAPPDAEALPALRSDGLVRPADPVRADEFADDLIRDFSLTRLLLVEGLELLAESDEPRQALRAARIACEARLAAAGFSENVWGELRESFAAIAAADGPRWAEVPLEALLTGAASAEQLAALWPSLRAAGDLQTLYRLAEQRHSADPGVLEALVETTVATQGGECLANDDAQQIVLAWLRGLAYAELGPYPLRARTRETLLARGVDRNDEFAVEALALLGPDLDEPAEAVLRELGGPWLAPAVEQMDPAFALAHARPGLLIELSEAYYLLEPSPAGEDTISFEGPIRGHRGTLGARLAEWTRGPFAALLGACPVEALRFINRLLGHAASRVGRASVGATLELPGIGPRHCAGDARAWAWYRGGGIVSYPCVSALLAVERWADRAIAQGVPPPAVAQLVLRDANNLAMPGLVAGVLVRHIERVGDALDPWLADPRVWDFEISRASGEGIMHVQGPDPSDVAGRDRRGWDLWDAAQELVRRALAEGDRAAVARLDAVADALLAAVRASAGEQVLGDLDHAASVLRAANYEPADMHDGTRAWAYKAPEEIATRLEEDRARRLTLLTAHRLDRLYVQRENASPPADLVADLPAARALLQLMPLENADFTGHAVGAVVAVAAAAIRAAADGTAALPADDVAWAAVIVIRAARSPALGVPGAEKRFSWRVAPLAADAVARLLGSAFDDVELDHDMLALGLASAAVASSVPARLALCTAIAELWDQPCRVRVEDVCRHEIGWFVVEQGIQDVTPAEAEDSPPTATAQTTPHAIAGPLFATLAATRSGACIADKAAASVDCVLDLYRSAAGRWPPVGSLNDGNLLAARGLVEAAIADVHVPLAGTGTALAAEPEVLEQFLHDIAELFTYGEAPPSELNRVWRVVITPLLDLLDADPHALGGLANSARTVAAMLPAPHLRVVDPDMSGTVERAARAWPPPSELADLVERWLTHASGSHEAVDAVARLAPCGQVAWQRAVALAWVEELIGARFSLFANHCLYLGDWLRELRGSGALRGESLARWRRIVDGLSAAGDRRAARLQQIDENG